MGENQGEGAHFVMVEEKRNILIGYASRVISNQGHSLTFPNTRLGIFVGFGSFFVMEKTLRVLGGDEGEHGHGHSHSHSHGPTEGSGSSNSVAKPDADGLRSRSSRTKEINGNGVVEGDDDKGKKQTSGPSKLSAYLNLFGDFVHNM